MFMMNVIKIDQPLTKNVNIILFREASKIAILGKKLSETFYLHFEYGENVGDSTLWK